ERTGGVGMIRRGLGGFGQCPSRVAVMYRGRVVETGETHQIIQAPRHEYTKSLIGAVPRADVKIDRFPRINYIETAAAPAKDFDIKEHWLGKARSDAKHRTAESGKPLVSVDGLTMRFVLRHAFLPKNRVLFDAVKNVSLVIAEGEVMALVGESGSGKSPVARILSGLYQPSAGSVNFDGQDVLKLRRSADINAIRRQVQMIFQDPYSSLNPRMRVDAIVAEPIHHHKLASSREETHAIVDDLLEIVGLGKAAGRKFPHEFSGGQRQRISIARALATRPRFLICDEPTSALDVSIQAQILNLLKDLQAALKLTILFISHDLPVVRQMCDRVAVMKKGELCELATADDLFNRPQHPYTRELLRLMPGI